MTIRRGDSVRADESACRFGLESRNRGRLRAGPVDFDASLENGAVFDADARRLDIADHRAVLLDFNAIGGIDIAGDFAEDDQFARGNFGIQDAAAADGKAVATDGDRSFDLAIDLQIFFGADAALNFEARADAGQAAGGGSSRTRKRARIGYGLGAALE